MRATRLFIAASLSCLLLACGDPTSPSTGDPAAVVQPRVTRDSIRATVELQRSNYAVAY